MNTKTLLISIAIGFSMVIGLMLLKKMMSK